MSGLFDVPGYELTPFRVHHPNLSKINEENCVNSLLHAKLLCNNLRLALRSKFFSFYRFRIKIPTVFTEVPCRYMPIRTELQTVLCTDNSEINSFMLQTQNKF
jgi:hypothetical protein